MNVAITQHPGRTSERQRLRVRIRGLVQGVGFRPFVHKLAGDASLTGTVRNDGDGVLLYLQGHPDHLKTTLHRLQHEAPPLALIQSIETTTVSAADYTEFTIVQSTASPTNTGIVPDAATCTLCLADINDETNRRFRYPFTNCTHCGPRLTIISNVPYDRKHTSMKDFELCQKCTEEYADPTDRRFHAQPNACPVCGPQLQLITFDNHLTLDDNPLAATAKLVRTGSIVAIKGLGGFQLACDAGQERSVNRLRLLKNRPDKPLALMARDVEQVRQYCHVSRQEEQLLADAAAPIVLLKKRKSSTRLHTLPKQLAPDSGELGFMLPNSPLHHLLLQELDIPIVLTSGNLSDEPQCIDDKIATDRFKPLADAILTHNRRILNRVDDSVVRVGIGNRPTLLRRARGYAPSPITLPDGFDPQTQVLAMGAELKNTFCFIKNGLAVLSTHIGDLANRACYDDYKHHLALSQRTYQLHPHRIAVDQHPQYAATRLGKALAIEQACTIDKIQHHHAHIVSCLVDNNRPLLKSDGSNNGPVLGLVLDGVGYSEAAGTDEHDLLWGCEFLLADYYRFERVARLKPVALLGGNQASRQPWRNTLAQLLQLGDWSQLSDRFDDLPIIRQLNQQPVDTYRNMIDAGFQSPLCSSAGRLFDAVSAALSLCPQQLSYEGQAAILLEQSASDWQSEGCFDNADLPTPYPFSTSTTQTLIEIDPAPMWWALLNDLLDNKPAGYCAFRFHTGLSAVLTSVAATLCRQCNANTIALSGGVFQNELLHQQVTSTLNDKAYTVLTHQQVPTNDGGLALGQAAIAAARAQDRTTSRPSDPQTATH